MDDEEQRRQALVATAPTSARVEGGAAPAVLATSTPTRDLRPGAQFGRFEIVARLGNGGMGDVYKALDMRLGRFVALKVLRLDFASTRASSSIAARLLREARAAASLNVRNAIAIFDVGEIDGTPYLAMELIEGETLRAIIRRNDSPLSDRLGWIRAMATVLSTAHRRGIVHRDLKPENVMVRTDGLLKVLDFGIAHQFRREPEEDGLELPALTTRGIAMGTLAYVAPEQRRGEPPTPRSDQFAWGVTAYELLMGERPWGAEGWSPGAIAAARTALAERQPPLGVDLRAVILRALDGDPLLRFASMDDLLEAMSVSDTSIASAAVPETRWRWLARGGFALTTAVYLFAALTSNPSKRPSAHRTMRGAVVSGEPTARDPQAVAAYEAGVQAERDDSIDAARKSFRAASELDPWFASAQVHFVLDGVDFGAEERERLRGAYAARADLGERDRQYIDALEPWSRERKGLGETARRFANLAERHPHDAHVLFHAARIQYIFGDYAASQETANAASRIDPGFVAAIGLRAAGLAALDRTEEAVAEYDRCLSASPSAASCLKHLMALEANDGRCDRLEELSRRLIARDPTDPEAYRSLASALFTRGAPREAVQVALDEAAARVPEEDRVAERARFDANLLAIDGRFAEADARASAWEAAFAGRTHEAPHVEPARFRMRLALETGRLDVAVALAQDYLRRRAGWTPDAWLDPRIEAYRVLYLSGAMTAAQIRAVRRDVLATADPGIDPGDQWGWVYAHLVRTREDAREAIAALAPGVRLTPRIARSARWEERFGLTFLRAGELDEAIAHLGRGSSACTTLTLPFEHMSTTYLLAEAFEAKGQRGNACDAYRAVVERWGGSLPASTTAQRAAIRISRICGQ